MRLCGALEVPDGQARGFSGADGGEVVVARRGDQYWAYLNRCPHRGTSLDWAPNRFMSDDARHLQCATHGALFRVEDGICVAGPCLGAGLVPVRIECVDGSLWLVR